MYRILASALAQQNTLSFYLVFLLITFYYDVCTITNLHLDVFGYGHKGINFRFNIKQDHVHLGAKLGINLEHPHNLW